LLPGKALPKDTGRNPFPIRESVECLATLARAVHYAHTQGVIHRDLKPGNVLIDERGEPKLTDFGLTKTTVDLTLTLAGVGSPNFMAPEQASRERGPTGIHTDVFGLGGILYFLLTGRPPFPGEMLGETIRAVLQDEPAPPRALRRDTPTDLETICLKCLNKTPAERYSSALEVAEDLERYLRWEPILARRMGPIGRFVR
jgi:serine/threonine protein kinase